MNQKNKRKRQTITLDRKWHQRFKMLSAHFDRKLEDLYDEAAAAYLADQPMFTRHASQNVR